MNSPIVISDSMLDVITTMLSVSNPGLTKEDVQKLFEGVGEKESTEGTLLFTRFEVAERLKVSLSTVDRWLAEGTLNKVQIGGSVRITEAEIQRLLQ